MCPQMKKIQLLLPTQSANVTNQGSIQVETIRLLRDIQRNMRPRNSDSDNGGGGGGEGNVRKGSNNGGSNVTHGHNRRTPDDTAFKRCIKNKYYWT